MNNIEIRGVTKQYRNGVKGLDSVTFSIGRGVFGLLGHNGAGKTTLMKAIATILKPTSGTITVMGHDTMREGDAVRKNIGYLPQELSMYPSLSVFDFVSYMAGLKGIREKAKVQRALEQVDLQDFSRRKIGQLSGGMKRRVGIAQALVGNPQILIVDEPTAGLDPEERVRFRSVLSRFAKDGRTVLLSTHLVEDVYQLSERLAVLRKGKLFFTGTSQELLRSVRGKIKALNLSSDQELLALQKKAVVISTTYEGNQIKARFMDENNAYSVSPVAETLEDAYVYCMGGKAHE
ncbi:MAG: ABC transporter ATP-binding protein [Clostridiales bacterium]|jgi:ABC-2 type transport system ATP-binding protein|nr:ABC transporter ATP-binding protein [Clostridiales bacterium]MCI1961447.1 ABC transporter ATP-binding protein [Clostridiales bacterium]MCI2022144.1 ABC transporter ATP-binding protein [Clostridiales bacterium]MCI2025841.1 ABC transporter ATP-binding protein [Clostridiales bacterium]